MPEELKYIESSLTPELLALSDDILSEVEELLMVESELQDVILIELVRTIDFWQISKNWFRVSEGIKLQELEIIKMGLNHTVAILLKKRPERNFPFMTSSPETQKFSQAILYKVGVAMLIRRAVEMIRARFLSVEKNDKSYVFFRTTRDVDQFLDEMEFSFLAAVEDKIKTNETGFYNGWKLIDIEDVQSIVSKAGFFLGVKNRQRETLSEYILPDIYQRMEPLVHSMESNGQTMVTYTSTVEIDNHFLSIATDLAIEWRNEAGFHPGVRLEGINGVDLIAVVTLLTSIHLKHIHFTFLASQKDASINILNNLTVWDFRDKLVQNLSDFSKIEKVTIDKVIETISLNPTDAFSFKFYTSNFMPLLINMGNGYLLRPVSGILRNPFFSIIPILESRNDKARHSISQLREEWVRSDLYAMFLGSRYQTIPHNIKLRLDGKDLTDIDACVYDNLTGELALFQIKWQDFFFNDVKKLRSKASNLVREMDDWSERVEKWIGRSGIDSFKSHLKLKSIICTQITSVHLFGISRSAARMDGYGFPLKSKNLVVANWPRLVRKRSELGPQARVLSTLFEKLKAQENELIALRPLPIDFVAKDFTLKFEDLWSAILPDISDKSHSN